MVAGWPPSLKAHRRNPSGVDLASRFAPRGPADNSRLTSASGLPVNGNITSPCRTSGAGGKSDPPPELDRVIGNRAQVLKYRLGVWPNSRRNIATKALGLL